MHLAYPLQNFIGTHITSIQLPILAKSHHTFHGWNFEIHFITLFKFKVPSPMVCIRLLPAIGCLQPVPYYVNFLQGLINQFETQEWKLAHFKPSNWRSTSPTIQGLNGSHRYSWIVTIVIRELNRRQIFIPIYLEINYTSSKHIINGLNSKLRLTIRLGMKSSA